MPVNDPNPPPRAFHPFELEVIDRDLDQARETRLY
jgi:hypothetical protein